MHTKNKDSMRTALYVLLFLFLLSLIPLYCIGTYAHPSADDYSYGISTKRVWEDTHSLSAVIDTAKEKTIDKFYRWQGNFSAIFLMYLQPGIFGENYYFLAPLLLITNFLICSLFFYYSVFTKITKSRPALALIASIVMISFALQFTPVPSDSFYWYNGAVYYTFFYSLSLLLYGILIQLYYFRHWHSKLLLAIFCAFLSFIIGGSNYSTALLNAILLFFTLVLCLIKQNHHIKYYIFVFAAGMFGLLISISGPGNLLRQSTIGEPHSAIISILLSFVYGFYSIANATSVPIFLFWFLMLPIFWKMIDTMDFSFRNPIFAVILTFCFYSAQITPVIYAQGIRIPYRIRNIVYFNYFIFVAFNLFYILGYLKQQKKLNRPLPTISSRYYYGIVIILFFFFCFGSIQVSENENKKIELTNLPFSASAAYSLVIGEAEQYDREVSLRVERLMNSPQKNLILKPFEHKPYVLFHSDITSDPYYWKNIHLAQYYKKRMVRLP